MALTDDKERSSVVCAYILSSVVNKLSFRYALLLVICCVSALLKQPSYFNFCRFELLIPGS